MSITKNLHFSMNREPLLIFRLLFIAIFRENQYILTRTGNDVLSLVSLIKKGKSVNNCKLLY